jgi:hypothetical protein
MDPEYVPAPAALFREVRMSAQHFRQYFVMLLPPPLRSLRSRFLSWSSIAVVQAPRVNPLSELLQENWNLLGGRGV